MDSNHLESLAVGDSFNFSGVQWAVRELNLFQDPSGYRTSEWRIESSRRGEYYLMVEYDPAQSGGPFWYLSERIPSPKLLNPEEGKDVYRQLQRSSLINETPPPALMSNGMTFLFESSSSGRTNWEGESQQRTTWEYWDKTHSRNLALEFWGNGDLLVYLARKIALNKIRGVKKGGAKNVESGFFGKGKPSVLEWICAIIVTLVGIMMFLTGVNGL